jgi:drug/metabolite transporter, DME family
MRELIADGTIMDGSANGSMRPARLETLHGHPFLRGCALVVLAGAVLSLGVFCIRNTSGTDAWVYISWRALGFTTALVTIAAVRGAENPWRQIVSLRGIAWIAALGMALSQVTFISSVKMATFAEVFLICSLAPLVAAALAWPVLGERLTLWTGVAIALGLVGVALMTNGGVSQAGGGQLGLVLAVLSMVGFAAYTLCTRGSSPHDLDAALIAVGLLTAAAGVITTQLLGLSLLASTRDAIIAFIHGGLLLSAGLFLFGQGSRTIDAVTFTMLAQAEAVLAPIWGYLFFSETPSVGTLFGGAVILLAIAIQAATAPRSGATER